jgi:hypothetical protein
MYKVRMEIRIYQKEGRRHSGLKDTKQKIDREEKAEQEEYYRVSVAAVELEANLTTVAGMETIDGRFCVTDGGLFT